MASTNDITGDKIQSKSNSKNYEENFDSIFRKPIMQTYTFIGQDGNWQLDFPNDDMANYHAKLNHANCWLDSRCVGEWVENGLGGMRFEKHINELGDK